TSLDMSRAPTRKFWRFFFSRRRRHTSSKRDWSSDVCSSDLDPDESLEQPLPAEFAPARAVVGSERRGVEAAQGGDQALGQELGAPQRSVNPLARERIEEVGGVTHEHGAASGRDGGARPLRERTG